MLYAHPKDLDVTLGFALAEFLVPFECPGIQALWNKKKWVHNWGLLLLGGPGAGIGEHGFA